MNSRLTDILQTYRHPCRVIEGKLTRYPSERRALAYLFAACTIYVAAGIPRLIQEHLAHRDNIPLIAGISGAILGVMILLPLALYFLAAATRILLVPLGWRVSWLHSRISLFWASLATAPLALLVGLIEGFFGRTDLHAALSWFNLGMLILFWMIGLYISCRAN